MHFLGIDHIDLRVPSLAAVERFYEELLPRLGLTGKRYCKVTHGGEAWATGTAEDHNTVEFVEENVHGRPARFLGVIEEDGAEPARGRIAFAVAAGSIEAWAQTLVQIGARDIEPSDGARYPAIFFADPLGTRLEVCARPPRP